MRTFVNHVPLPTGTFILSELILLTYRFIRLLTVPGEPKRWWAFNLLILLLLYNATIGMLAHIAWTILFNFALGLLYVATTFRDRLGIFPGSAERQLVRLQEEQLLALFLENCQKHNLTRREIEVALLIRKGYKNWQIAAELFISRKTVESHIQRIYEKVGAGGRFALLEALGR